MANIARNLRCAVAHVQGGRGRGVHGLAAHLRGTLNEIGAGRADILDRIADMASRKISGRVNGVAANLRHRVGGIAYCLHHTLADISSRIDDGGSKIDCGLPSILRDCASSLEDVVADMLSTVDNGVSGVDRCACDCAGCCFRIVSDLRRCADRHIGHGRCDLFTRMDGRTGYVGHRVDWVLGDVHRSVCSTCDCVSDHRGGSSNPVGERCDNMGPRASCSMAKIDYQSTGSMCAKVDPVANAVPEPTRGSSYCIDRRCCGLLDEMDGRRRHSLHCMNGGCNDGFDSLDHGRDDGFGTMYNGASDTLYTVPKAHDDLLYWIASRN